MAYTVARQFTVFGDQRVAIVNVTADAATQAVESGLDYITGFSIGAQSCATTGFSCKANLDASGTAANGTLGISAAASGDAFYVVCYGR